MVRDRDRMWLRGAGTATASLLLGALKCGEIGAASYGQFGLVALLAYAGLAVAGWLVILACRCLASLVDSSPIGPKGAGARVLAVCDQTDTRR